MIVNEMKPCWRMHSSQKNKENDCCKMLHVVCISATFDLRLSPTTTPKIQDTFVLWVTLQAKGSIPIRHLLQQQNPKKNPFCKWVFRERILIFGLCLSGNPKWVSRIGTLLEANFRSLATYFGFRCPFRSLIGSLRSSLIHKTTACISKLPYVLDPGELCMLSDPCLHIGPCMIPFQLLHGNI